MRQWLQHKRRADEAAWAHLCWVACTRPACNNAWSRETGGATTSRRAATECPTVVSNRVVAVVAAKAAVASWGNALALGCVACLPASSSMLCRRCWLVLFGCAALPDSPLCLAPWRPLPRAIAGVSSVWAREGWLLGSDCHAAAGVVCGATDPTLHTARAGLWRGWGPACFNHVSIPIVGGLAPPDGQGRLVATSLTQAARKCGARPC